MHLSRLAHSGRQILVGNSGLGDPECDFGSMVYPRTMWRMSVRKTRPTVSANTSLDGFLIFG